MISAKKIEKTDPEASLVAEWLKNDAFHQQAGISEEEIWEPNSEVALISDERGPIMAVRFQTAVRVAIQFNPETPYRNAKAGRAVVAWFEKLARQKKATEVIIRPGGKAEKFSEKLGFRSFLGKFIKV